MIDVAWNCCTTTRHKTHSTELEVYYPWHPWFGLKVTTNRPFRRRGVARVYATLEHEGRLQQLEMPGWMFDRATCAAMPLADHPSVGVNHLRALGELLKSATGTKGENLIETRHLDSSRKGDADEKKENATPHATRSVSITDSHTALVDPAPRRAAESSGAACRTVPRGSRRSSSLPRKGGRQ